MSQPKVIFIVLNFNRCEDTLKCLTSVAQSTYKNHKTMMLDAGSHDDSVKVIQAAFPAVEIIELTENHGYAGNNNIGIAAAMNSGADWIFVLNEDTILASDCLSRLIEVGESNPRIGVLGPMVYHHDEPMVIQSAGGRIGPHWESLHLAQNELDQGQFHEPHPVEWISGCGILIRRAVIDEVGMIDERYFYYWEETEWCLRAGRAGWQVVHVPQARLWHRGAQRNDQPKPFVTYYGTRNRLLTLAKHQASITTWMMVWLQIIRTLTSWSVRPKWRFMHEHRRAMWLGVVDFLYHRWGGPVQL